MRFRIVRCVSSKSVRAGRTPGQTREHNAYVLQYNSRFAAHEIPISVGPPRLMYVVSVRVSVS